MGFVLSKFNSSLKAMEALMFSDLIRLMVRMEPMFQIDFAVASALLLGVCLQLQDWDKIRVFAKWGIIFLLISTTWFSLWGTAHIHLFHEDESWKSFFLLLNGGMVLTLIIYALMVLGIEITKKMASRFFPQRKS